MDHVIVFETEHTWELELARDSLQQAGIPHVHFRREDPGEGISFTFQVPSTAEPLRTWCLSVPQSVEDDARKLLATLSMDTGKRARMSPLRDNPEKTEYHTIGNTPVNLQPTLQGTLVTLRPLRTDDFPALYAVAADPLIWEQHPDRDRYKEEVFREFFREAMASRGALLISDAADGRVIGSSRYFGYNAEKREVEVGWTFLARSHWGGRYNREMKDLMLRHAFRFVDTVVFLIGPENIRSQRAVEKIGAIRIGSRKNNKGRESVVYGITAAGFVGL